MKPKPLVWTARKPRKAGWYFVRDGIGRISVVWVDPEFAAAYTAYAGPLVPPEWKS